MQPRIVTHVEWATADLEALKNFVEKLFDWSIQSFGEGAGYYLVRPGGDDQPTVGLMYNPEAVVGSGSPNVYIVVESIDATLQRGQELGGQVIVPKTAIIGTGAYAFLKAPDGNLIGLHEGNPA